jgi:Xaa-Pro dipeptidase
VELIRNACKYADEGMRLMLNEAYYGESVLEMYSTSKKLQLKLVKSGSFDPFQNEFLTAGWPAPYSAKPHGIPLLNGRFKEGPLAAMSIQRINGYFAENERTFFLSPPSEKMKMMFADMREARKRAFKMIKPGARLNEIDKVANDYLKERGYEKYLLHTISHGIGLEIHEDPWIGKEFDFILMENMVISIEPGIYIPEIGGVRHSDTILVTKDGFEVLTNFPTDIDSLTIRKPRILKRLKGKIIQKILNMSPE